MRVARQSVLVEVVEEEAILLVAAVTAKKKSFPSLSSENSYYFFPSFLFKLVSPLQKVFLPFSLRLSEQTCC